MHCLSVFTGWSAKTWIERYKLVASCPESYVVWFISQNGWVFPYLSQFTLKHFDQVTLTAAPVLFPIVLVHAYTDVPILTGTWVLVEKFLFEMGVEYFTPQIPPHGSIDERSISLIHQIATRYSGRTVHLFGHSMVGRALLHSFHPHANYTGRAELMLEISPRRQRPLT